MHARIKLGLFPQAHFLGWVLKSKNTPHPSPAKTVCVWGLTCENPAFQTDGANSAAKNKMTYFQKSTNRRTNAHWLTVAHLSPPTGSQITEGVFVCMWIWSQNDLTLKDTNVSSVLQHVLYPQRKMQESKARRIRWLLLLSYAAVVKFFLLSCNTWRFVPGATCWELIACHCLCAFVFSSLSTRWYLSKPGFAVWCRFRDDHLLVSDEFG